MYQMRICVNEMKLERVNYLKCTESFASENGSLKSKVTQRVKRRRTISAFTDIVCTRNVNIEAESSYQMSSRVGVKQGHRLRDRSQELEAD